MSKNCANIEINLMGKEYLIACAPHEEKSVHAAARYLKEQTAQMRQTVTTTDNEKILAITALNLSANLLSMRHELEQKIKRLTQLIESGRRLPSMRRSRDDSESLEITL